MKRLVLLSLLVACGSSESTPDPVIGEDITVVAFDDEWIHFGDPDTRQVDRPVAFPAPGQSYESVTLTIALACPANGCDWWDRLGRLSLVAGDQEIELARFITPYRVGMEMRFDVTDLQRLLEGDATLRVFIDTWVGPGSANGEGWLVDASFDFVGGVRENEPFAVIPLWGPHGVVYGDPARPTAETVDVELPEGTVAGHLYGFVTGHGQGNADNCAEFCAREHTFTVGDQPVTREVWRDDCATTAAPGQQGTFQYPRAGWCPGASVRPFTADLYLEPGPLSVTYDVAAYDNTCRPDAPTCEGCTLGTGCEYDGGAHTEPNFQQSAVLVLLR